LCWTEKAVKKKLIRADKKERSNKIPFFNGIEFNYTSIILLKYKIPDYGI